MKKFILILSILLLPFVSFAISDSELLRINKMLDLLVKEENLIFIRNNSEYDAVRAKEHLELKLSHAKSRINTAEEFIDNVASFSSITKRPYLIKEKDTNKVTEAKIYFHQLLKKADESAAK